MPEDPSFRELIRRVRAGDDQAAAELVRRYEPAIRRAVRARLTNPGLRRLLDSMDICQSVLASFFVRAAAGEFDLEEPAQLSRLLAVMARNKVIKHAARQQAARRDYRRMQDDGGDQEFVDPGPRPSQVVAYQELLEKLRGRLTAEERHLAEQRAQGRAWADIAAEIGSTPDASRLKLSRAIDRVVQELDL